jgi:hypothetical protein
VNVLMEVLGWIGWLVGIIAVVGLVFIVWEVLARALDPQAYEPDTETDLPKCKNCGWVEGVNSDCPTCQRTRKVLP